MSRARTFTTLLLIVMSVLDGTSAPAGSTVSPTEIPATDERVPGRITVRNETDNDQPYAILEWAVDRYDLAGLGLPDIEITFHEWEPSKAECAGQGGLHSVSQDGHFVEVCGVGVPSRRRLVLHELAHAWAHDNLTQGQRDSLLVERGLEVWSDVETDWSRRGTEHAAEIITWGLALDCDQRYFLNNELIGDESYEDLAELFEFLTGVAPICRHETA